MKKSAGILPYRVVKGKLQFFLVHPGGPFWKHKDLAVWSIPKGEFTDEQPLVAAKREFEEETGYSCEGNFMALAPVKQKSGKLVYAFAIEMDIDATTITSNIFEMEWPPKSGRMESFPEIDKGDWFETGEAKKRINPSQSDLIDQVIDKLNSVLA
jgi:predicted NUDIX family NTP pyrophosphohydrolase